MKRYLSLAVVAALLGLGAAHHAMAQALPYLVNCQLPSTPCTYPGGSVATNAGDPPFVWAGKDNANFLTLFGYFGPSATPNLGTPSAINLANATGFPTATYPDSLQTPTTAFNITIGGGVAALVLNPAGTLATGTIVMPASPIDKQNVCVTSSHTVTALTVSANAGQSIIAAPTSMSAGGFCYHYVLSLTTWFRLY